MHENILKKKICRLLSSAVLFSIMISMLGTLFSTPALAAMPSVSAASAILIDADSGSVLWQQNADERRPMASTTKIMTALVALETAPLDTLLTVPSSAVGIEGSSACLKGGEAMTLEDLLYIMLLESANDAAAAIAVTLGGSIEGFADMMNEKAHELGLENTSFSNPHGLDDENHYTTAAELAKIAAAAMKNPEFVKIVSTYRCKLPLSGGGFRYLLNHNKMLKLYDGALGVKTGFTKKSGRCLVSAAKRGDTTLIAVTLSAPDDWNDHRAMLDFGFAGYETRILQTPGEYSNIVPIIGKKITYAEVVSDSGASGLFKVGAKPCEAHVYLPRFFVTRIAPGDCVGEIVFTSDDGIVARVPLCVKQIMDVAAEQDSAGE